MIINDLSNSLSAMEHNLGIGSGTLHTVAATHDLGDFLQRALLSLDKEEVDDDELERVPEDKKEIVFPASALTNELVNAMQRGDGEKELNIRRMQYPSRRCCRNWQC